MKRRGTSLIEVLTAIFIMALGLIALLTLFPLGAVQMARAVQDERAAQLAANAASVMRNYWKGMCDQAMAQTDGNKMMFQAELMNMVAVPPPQAQPPMNLMFWFPMAMDDPNSGIATTANGVQFSNAPWPPATTVNAAMQTDIPMARRNTPSFPVYVDPIGWKAGGGASSRTALWLGVNPPAGSTDKKPIYAIPRRTLSAEDWYTSMSSTTPGPTKTWTPMGSAQIVRNCLLADDMNFNLDGTALVKERTGEYSCAWLLRRENNSDRSDVTMTVVVYFRRSTESLSDEPTYMATPVVSTNASGATVFGNVVTLHYASSDQKPSLRAGGWVLDETLDPTSPQGFFYRVTSVGDEYTPPSTQQPPGLTKAVDLQLETTLKAGPMNTAPNKPSRKFVVPDRVLEVFEKGPIEMGSAARVN